MALHSASAQKAMVELIPEKGGSIRLGLEPEMLWKQSWPIVLGNKTVGGPFVSGCFCITICRRLEGTMQYLLRLCFDTKLIGQIWARVYLCFFCICICICTRG